MRGIIKDLNYLASLALAGIFYGATEQTPAGTTEQVRFATPPSAPDPELFDDSNDPDHPHRYRRVLDMVEPDAPVPGQAERLLLTPSGEPSTYAEAEHDEIGRAHV